MKLISFCLYGEDEKYWIGARRNIELGILYYPGWVLRFYVDENCKELVKKYNIQGENVEVQFKKRTDGTDGMFWRFLPAGEKNIDYLLIRDTDSRFSIREKKIVEERTNSNKDFHIIRDHIFHDRSILGGLWGVKGEILKNIEKDIKRWSKKSNYGDDQNFLHTIIYPKVKNSSMQHGGKFNFGIKTFPIKDTGENLFIGQVFDKNDDPIFPTITIKQKVFYYITYLYNYIYRNYIK